MSYRSPANPETPRESFLDWIMPSLRAGWVLTKMLFVASASIWLIGFSVGRMSSCNDKAREAQNRNEYLFCRSTCDALGGRNLPRFVVYRHMGNDQCRCSFGYPAWIVRSDADRRFDSGKILTFPVGASNASDFLWISAPTMRP